MGALAAAIGIAFATPARGETGDPWLGRDKALHFALSAALSAGGYAGGLFAFDEPWVPFAAGAGLALGAGVAKELYDLSGRGTASGRDLAWDAAGTAVGLLTAWAFDRLVVRRLACSPVPLAHEPK